MTALLSALLQVVPRSRLPHKKPATLAPPKHQSADRGRPVGRHRATRVGGGLTSLLALLGPRVRGLSPPFSLPARARWATPRTMGCRRSPITKRSVEPHAPRLLPPSARAWPVHTPPPSTGGGGPQHKQRPGRDCPPGPKTPTASSKTNDRGLCPAVQSTGRTPLPSRHAPGKTALTHPKTRRPPLDTDRRSTHNPPRPCGLASRPAFAGATALLAI